MLTNLLADTGTLLGLIVAIPVIIYVLIIAVVIVIVWSIISTSRNTKAISEKLDTQNKMLSALLKLQNASARKDGNQEWEE